MVQECNATEPRFCITKPPFSDRPCTSRVCRIVRLPSTTAKMLPRCSASMVARSDSSLAIDTETRRTTMPDSAKAAPGLRKSFTRASTLSMAKVKSASVLMGTQSIGVGKTGGSGGGDTSATGAVGGKGGMHCSDHTPTAAQVAGHKSATIFMSGGTVMSRPKPLAACTTSSDDVAQYFCTPPNKGATAGAERAQSVGMPMAAKNAKGWPGGSSHGSAMAAPRRQKGRGGCGKG